MGVAEDITPTIAVVLVWEQERTVATPRIVIYSISRIFFSCFQGRRLTSWPATFGKEPGRTRYAILLCEVGHELISGHPCCNSVLSTASMAMAREMARKTKRVLLLIAHPDDECMFFGPTVLSMTMQPTSYEVRVLCISCGNAEGLGERRKSELLASCTFLKVPAENVEVLDHPALQDGHEQDWNKQLLVEIIHQTTTSREIDIVITFDSYGVSGHPNHIALSHALRAYLRDFKRFRSDADVPLVECWELVSLNIVRKYSGVLEAFFSTLGWLMTRQENKMRTFLNPNPLISVAAMKQHRSQWVWFRWLFVVFAAYTYVNVLRKMESVGQNVSRSKEIVGWID